MVDHLKWLQLGQKRNVVMLFTMPCAFLFKGTPIVFAHTRKTYISLLSARSRCRNSQVYKADKYIRIYWLWLVKHIITTLGTSDSCGWETTNARLHLRWSGRYNIERSYNMRIHKAWITRINVGLDDGKSHTRLYMVPWMINSDGAVGPLSLIASDNIQISIFEHSVETTITICKPTEMWKQIDREPTVLYDTIAGYENSLHRVVSFSIWTSIRRSQLNPTIGRSWLVRRRW